MRIYRDNPVTKEATFKESKKTKKKNMQNPKSDRSCSDGLKEDEEMEKFLKSLKRGTGKYKGMLPMKCFNCVGISHFTSKFHHAKNKESDE
jgi:hypothetical protein